MVAAEPGLLAGRPYSGYWAVCNAVVVLYNAYQLCRQVGGGGRDGDKAFLLSYSSLLHFTHFTKRLLFNNLSCFASDCEAVQIEIINNK